MTCDRDGDAVAVPRRYGTGMARARPDRARSLPASGDDLPVAPPAHRNPSGVVDLGAVVANNVRAERVRRGWRQEDLAARLGWSRAGVGHLESGRRRPAVTDLPPLCRALGLTLDALLVGAQQEDLDALRILDGGTAAGPARGSGAPSRGGSPGPNAPPPRTS